MSKYNKKSGKTDDSATQHPDCPDVIMALARLIHSWRTMGKRWPVDMPIDPRTAARWWIDRQELRQFNEHDEIRMTIPKSKMEDEARAYWFTPYLDRVRFTLTQFRKLTPTEQRIVLGCAEEKIYWRGDPIDIFYTHEKSIYNETLHMREIGLTAYRKEALRAMKTVDLSMPDDVLR